MKFKELQYVKTMKDFPSEGISKNERGTIVLCFTAPDEAYEVEFVNNDGSTRAMFPILAEHLELVE